MTMDQLYFSESFYISMLPFNSKGKRGQTHFRQWQNKKINLLKKLSLQDDQIVKNTLFDRIMKRRKLRKQKKQAE